MEERPINPHGCIAGTALSIIIWILILTAIFSCTAPLHALHPEGKVKQVEQNRIEVAFPDALHAGRHGRAWFFFPGIGEVDTSAYSVVVKIQPKRP